MADEEAELPDARNTQREHETASWKRKTKNVSITFRLDRAAVGRLRKEAAEKDLSVNTLVSQIIRNHLDWHSIAAKAGFISVRRGLVTKLLDNLTYDEIKSMADHIARASNRDFLMLLRNKISLESALDFLESWLRVSGFAYRHETTHDFRHSFVIQHDMGKKWSLYLAELYRHLFEECKATKFNFDARESTLSFVVEA